MNEDTLPPQSPYGATGGVRCGIPLTTDFSIGF